MNIVILRALGTSIGAEIVGIVNLQNLRLNENGFLLSWR